MSANATTLILLTTPTAASVTPTYMDMITMILVIGFGIIAAGYIVSLLLNKRTLDAVQTVSAATLTATQSLISTEVYYGAYERSETLRTVASIIGIDQIRDTALSFIDGRRHPLRPAETTGTTKSA